MMRSKYEQAMSLLAEKDLEIAALQEQLALRQDNSPTEATEACSTSSSVVDAGGDDNL